VRILHRFYDLHSGGGEVVVGTIVQAFPEHQHVLVFNRFRETWLSAQLKAAANARLVQVQTRGIRQIVDAEAPDVLVYHYYPPMTAEDFADLSADQLARTLIYSHWFRDVPRVAGVKGYVFPSLFGARVGEGIEKHQKSVILNPIADRFFAVKRKPRLQYAVGRHSRDDAIKFPDDFFDLYEQIAIPDLQVHVLGCYPPLAAALARGTPAVRHNYWLLPANTMDVCRFLECLGVYVYKTHDTFAETCPLVILEAMAAGIPVVAEHKGGIVDLVRHGETGYLCRTREDFKRHVEALYHDTVLHQRTTQQARQWARDHVSLPAFRRNLGQLIGAV
jgi:glycosyltransferase involved in cell wall biosynthesis